tara:strand:- start:1233 stop:1592 length:360 start_codon:yes stop_codon:yes gene_type:complete
MVEVAYLDINEGIYEKSLKRALRKVGLHPRKVVGTVLQLHPVYFEFSERAEMLTSIQAVNWFGGTPAKPLKLIVAAFESVDEGTVLRELIPWRGPHRQLMADFRTEENQLLQRFEMKIL